jgi:hypothetical protein
VATVPLGRGCLLSAKKGRDWRKSWASCTQRKIAKPYGSNPTAKISKLVCSKSRESTHVTSNRQQQRERSVNPWFLYDETRLVLDGAPQSVQWLRYGLNDWEIGLECGQGKVHCCWRHTAQPAVRGGSWLWSRQWTNRGWNSATLRKYSLYSCVWAQEQ